MNGNQVGVRNAGLGDLGDYGGPTQTIPTLAGSPAIGRGDPGLAGTAEQRGLTRRPPITVGAYQATTTATALSASAGTTVYGQSVTFPATVTSPGGTVAGSVTFRDGGTVLGSVTLDGSGRASLATATLSVGGHTITASYLGTALYPPSGGSVGLTVNRAALTVTADNKSRVYGQANPALTATYNGFVNGDTPGTLGGTLTLNTMATAASGVGVYAITAGGTLSSPNDTISYANGTLTLTRTPLTITADNKSKVHGQANPPLTASYS